MESFELLNKFFNQEGDYKFRIFINKSLEKNQIELRIAKKSEENKLPKYILLVINEKNLKVIE